MEYINVIASSLISLIGIIITAFITNSLTKYRITKLEEKVDKHNSIIERVYKLEQKMEDIKK